MNGETQGRPKLLEDVCPLKPLARVRFGIQQRSDQTGAHRLVMAKASGVHSDAVSPFDYMNLWDVSAPALKDHIYHPQVSR